MAKDYTIIRKEGWHCVQGKLGIKCSRDNRPCESVEFFRNKILIVDAIACETVKTIAKRTHTECIFPAGG